MATINDLENLKGRANRWRDWAIGIRGAHELENARDYIDDYLPLLDTSELVEYARPSSLLRNQYPTRLDNSLNLLFAPGSSLFASGPHAQEIVGVSHAWNQQMEAAREELKAVRRRFEDQPQVDKVEGELRKIIATGIKSHAKELIHLLRVNYKWLFSASRIRRTGFFEALMLRLRVPSVKDLGLPDGFVYRPDKTNIDEWLKRLDDTVKGRREPGPNVVDAYALDQLQQLSEPAVRQSRRLPILLTHSGKIFEALRYARKTHRDFFRIHGVSLVQHPLMELVRHVKRDADESGNLTQVTEELARQQERGETVGEMIDALTADTEGTPAAVQWSDTLVKEELDKLEKSWDQWDTLRRVLQRLEVPEEAPPGMLDGLEEMLEQATDEDAAKLQSVLRNELDKLITEVDRLQGEVTNLISPPPPPSQELELTEEAFDEISAFVILDRPRRRAPLVPSSSYPTGSFRFRDRQVMNELARSDELTGPLKDSSPAEQRHQLRQARNWVRSLVDLRGRPEYYLLLAVSYLARERWVQADDVARKGIDAIARQQSASGSLAYDTELALGELLLVRAGAMRANVHSMRIEFPTICEALLTTAVDDCLKSLEIQRRLAQIDDPRCLRELAVIFCSAHDPVYGPGSSKDWTMIRLPVRSDRFAQWVTIEKDDPLLAASAFARRAYEERDTDRRSHALYINTHLYVMTEIDRRLLFSGQKPINEAERLTLAAQFDAFADPNLLDTLMWHKRILAEGQLKNGDETWRSSEHEAVVLSNQLGQYLEELGGIRYYQRLVKFHQMRVNTPLAMPGTFV